MFLHGKRFDMFLVELVLMLNNVYRFLAIFCCMRIGLVGGVESEGWGGTNNLYSSALSGLRNVALTLRGMPPTLTKSLTAYQGPFCKVKNRSGGQ